MARQGRCIGPEASTPPLADVIMVYFRKPQCSGGCSGSIDFGGSLLSLVGAVHALAVAVLAVPGEVAVMAVAFLASDGFAVTMALTAVEIEVLKEHYILVGADDCLHLFEVGFLRGAALGAHGRVVALAVGAECLLAGLAIGKLLFVKLFQLVFLSIAEGEPFEYAGGAVAFLEVFGALGIFNTSLLLTDVVVLLFWATEGRAMSDIAIAASPRIFFFISQMCF